MANYMSPGVYVTEIDASDKINPLLDFPEFSREVFDEIMKKVPAGHGFNYKNSDMTFHSKTGNISVNVTLHDGFARIRSHPLLKCEVEFSNPDAIDRIVSIVVSAITHDTPMAWKNIVPKLIGMGVPRHDIEIIDTPEKLIEIFGDPLL